MLRLRRCPIVGCRDCLSRLAQARIFHEAGTGASHRPAELKYKPLLNDGAFKRVACTLRLCLDVLSPSSSSASSAFSSSSSRESCPVVTAVAAAVATAVATTTAAGAPLEAYSSAGAVPDSRATTWGGGAVRDAKAAELNLFFTQPLPLALTAGPAGVGTAAAARADAGGGILASTVHGTLRCYAVVCAVEPATAAIGECILRAV